MVAPSLSAVLLSAAPYLNALALVVCKLAQPKVL